MRGITAITIKPLHTFKPKSRQRQKRLNEVYEHLHNHFGVHTKGEFADIIKYARAYISSAMNGNERYLTDKLFTNICEAYPGVFNLDYLLTGNGTLLTADEEIKSSEIKQMNNASANTIDPSSQTNAIIAAYIEAVSQLKERIKEKDATIAEKDERIAELKAHNRDLRQQLNKYENSDIDRYPFPIGAADGDKHKTARK